MGSRISEESYLKPKPMIEIGEKPILWHIMKIYSYYGFHDFIICCGYKGHMIKEYFMDYLMYESDVTIDLKDNTTIVYENITEPWKVTLVNTGFHTNTAGRIMRVKKYVKDEAFMMTYGDGVSDIDINSLLEFHKKCGKIATITAAKPAGRWGTLQIDDNTNLIKQFKEKDKEDQSWVNAGFAVFQPQIFQYLEDEMQQLECEPYEKAAADGQMASYKHSGFWHPMDTVRDRIVLQEYWESNHAPWKLWDK
jgi:glucose-1-phosphate cytidylyltransferase